MSHKKAIIIISSIIMVIILTGCSSSTLNDYTLNVSVTGSGIVTFQDSTNRIIRLAGVHTGYNYKNESITFEASTNEGWRFNTWAGDVISTNKKIAVKMDSSKNIIAIFKPTYELIGVWKGSFNNPAKINLTEKYIIFTDTGNKYPISITKTSETSFNIYYEYTDIIVQKRKFVANFDDGDSLSGFLYNNLGMKIAEGSFNRISQ